MPSNPRLRADIKDETTSPLPTSRGSSFDQSHASRHDVATGIKATFLLRQCTCTQLQTGTELYLPTAILGNLSQICNIPHFNRFGPRQLALCLTVDRKVMTAFLTSQSMARLESQGLKRVISLIHTSKSLPHPLLMSWAAWPNLGYFKE